MVNQGRPRRAAPTVIDMIKEQALIPLSSNPNHQNGTRAIPANGSTRKLATSTPTQPAKPVGPAAPPLNDELANSILDGHGLRGWLRALRIGRVLGLLSLYLFLDTYDIRATFNERTSSRRRQEVGNQSWQTQCSPLVEGSSGAKSRQEYSCSSLPGVSRV